MEQIGDNRKYDGVKYDDSNDAVFLSDRIHPLSKDTKFQQRKEINPLKKKETVQEIGTVSGFKAKWKLEDVVDAKAVFLSDDSYYKQRTAMITNSEGTVQAKLGPTEIGKIDDFKKPEWSEQIEQELKANDNIFADKIKKENKDYAELAKLEHKKGAVEVGTIKDYDPIDYRLTKDDLMGGFLKERAWYDSSAVSELFDEGISHLLKSLPSHKLRVMDHVPLPSGFQSKIVWLRKLRDIIKDEEKENNKMLRMEQLDQVNAMLVVLEDQDNQKSKVKKKKQSKKKKTSKN